MVDNINLEIATLFHGGRKSAAIDSIVDQTRTFLYSICSNANNKKGCEMYSRIVAKIHIYDQMIKQKKHREITYNSSHFNSDWKFRLLGNTLPKHHSFRSSKGTVLPHLDCSP